MTVNNISLNQQWFHTLLDFQWFQALMVSWIHWIYFLGKQALASWLSEKLTDPLEYMGLAKWSLRALDNACSLMEVATTLLVHKYWQVYPGLLIWFTSHLQILAKISLCAPRRPMELVNSTPHKWCHPQLINTKWDHLYGRFGTLSVCQSVSLSVCQE